MALGVITCNQRSSVTISGHQWRAVTISGHQWSSVVISGHQRSPAPSVALTARLARDDALLVRLMQRVSEGRPHTGRLEKARQGLGPLLLLHEDGSEACVALPFGFVIVELGRDRECPLQRDHRLVERAAARTGDWEIMGDYGRLERWRVGEGEIGRGGGGAGQGEGRLLAWERALSPTERTGGGASSVAISGNQSSSVAPEAERHRQIEVASSFHEHVLQSGRLLHRQLLVTHCRPELAEQPVDETEITVSSHLALTVVGLMREVEDRSVQRERALRITKL